MISWPYVPYESMYAGGYGSGLKNRGLESAVVAKKWKMPWDQNGFRREKYVRRAQWLPGGKHAQRTQQLSGSKNAWRAWQNIEARRAGQLTKKKKRSWGLLESKNYYIRLDIVYLTKSRPMHLEKKSRPNSELVATQATKYNTHTILKGL